MKLTSSLRPTELIKIVYKLLCSQLSWDTFLYCTLTVEELDFLWNNLQEAH